MKRITTFAAAILLSASAASAGPFHGMGRIKVGPQEVSATLISSAASSRGPASIAAAAGAAALPSYLPSTAPHLQIIEGLSEAGSLMILGAVMIGVASLLIRRKNSSPASA